MKKLSLEQMEETKGGMPCGAAIAGVVATGIAFTFFTAGIGTLLLGGVGLGFAGWGYLDSCYPEMMAS